MSESQNVPEKSKRGLMDFLKFVWEAVWDFKKTLKLRLEKDWKTAKSYPVFLCCVVILTAIVVFIPTAYLYQKHTDRVRNDYQNRNSFINGQLTTTKDELDKSQKEFDRKKTDYVTTIANLKTDYNEQLRSKDAEILKVTGERDSALNRAAMAVSMPGDLFSIYTNIAANAPTNLNQFATMLNSISNEVATASLVPKFTIEINGLPVPEHGNFTTTIISTNRNVFIRVRNVSDISADNLTVAFATALNETNFITSGYWIKLNSMYSGGNNTWKTQSETVIASGNYFSATTFTISTNYSTSVLQTDITIYSSKSRRQDFFVNFVYLDGKQMETNLLPQNVIIDRGN